MATGATLHLEGNEVWESCTILGLPVPPRLCQFSNRSWTQAQGAAGDATQAPRSACHFVSLGKEATVAWEKSSFWSIMASHFSCQEVPWHRQVSSTSINTKSLILPIHLFCQLSLVSYICIYLGGTQQDRCNHAHVLLADL